MFQPAKWILCALVIVASIAQVSNLIVVEDVTLTSETEALLPAPLPETLSIHDVQNPDQLHFGSQVETFRFTLSSGAPYTLRYLTVRVESTGLNTDALQNVQNWQLFAVNKGKIDYTKPLGRGEKWQEKDLRLRLFTDENVPYQGAPGKQEFLLTAKILSDPTASQTPPTLHLSLPSDPKIDWAWLATPLEGSWLSVSEWNGYQDLAQ